MVPRTEELMGEVGAGLAGSRRIGVEWQWGRPAGAGISSAGPRPGCPPPKPQRHHARPGATSAPEKAPDCGLWWTYFSGGTTHLSSGRFKPSDDRTKPGDPRDRLSRDGTREGKARFRGHGRRQSHSQTQDGSGHTDTELTGAEDRRGSGGQRQSGDPELHLQAGHSGQAWDPIQQAHGGEPAFCLLTSWGGLTVSG